MIGPTDMRMDTSGTAYGVYHLTSKPWIEVKVQGGKIIKAFEHGIAGADEPNVWLAGYGYLCLGRSVDAIPI